MCESNAFLVRGDREETLLEEVTHMEPVEGGYR
ncbi:MAG: CooT family nickel-binding protein, partial [Candidatus Dadabacteria bacterium]